MCGPQGKKEMDQRALAEEIFQNRLNVKVLYLKYHPDKPTGSNEKFVLIRNICERLPPKWCDLNHEDFKDCLQDIYREEKTEPNLTLDEDDLKLWELFNRCTKRARPEPRRDGPSFSRVCNNCSRVFYGSSPSCKSCCQTHNPFREPTPTKDVDRLKKQMQQNEPIKTFKKFKK